MDSQLPPDPYQCLKHGALLQEVLKLCGQDDSGWQQTATKDRTKQLRQLTAPDELLLTALHNLVAKPSAASKDSNPTAGTAVAQGPVQSLTAAGPVPFLGTAFAAGQLLAPQAGEGSDKQSVHAPAAAEAAAVQQSQVPASQEASQLPPDQAVPPGLQVLVEIQQAQALSGSSRGRLPACECRAQGQSRGWGTMEMIGHVPVIWSEL